MICKDYFSRRVASAIRWQVDVSTTYVVAALLMQGEHNLLIFRAVAVSVVAALLMQGEHN